MSFWFLQNERAHKLQKYILSYKKDSVDYVTIKRNNDSIISQREKDQNSLIKINESLHNQNLKLDKDKTTEINRKKTWRKVAIGSIIYGVVTSAIIALIIYLAI